MIRALKHRLTHIQPSSVRYRIAHHLVKEEKLRKAHACTLYWVYLPVAVFAFVVSPFFRLAVFLIAQPIAWMSGYRKIGKLIPTADADAMEELSKQPIYENAHVHTAPWRVVLPALVLGVLVLVGFTPARTVELGALAAIVVGLGIGWFLFRRWGRVTEVWDKVCPRLEVEPE